MNLLNEQCKNAKNWLLVLILHNQNYVITVSSYNYSEENSLRKFIQTSYIKQIHQNSEYLLDKCYIFFFKLLNLIFLIQSSAVVNNKACKLAHYLMLVVNVPGCQATRQGSSCHYYVNIAWDRMYEGVELKILLKI